MSLPLRQTLVGLLMLPLTLVPFGLYFGNTQEGRVVWAKVSTRLAPPEPPVLTTEEQAEARELAPSYEGAVALLAYHGLGSGPEGEGPADLTIPPDRFAEQLAWLDAAGMNAVTAREVALAFSGEGTLPPNAVMLSFDDGRTDAMLYADPVLESLDMRATMFVITGAASRPGVYYVGWDRLRDYAASGRWDMQNHTDAGHHRQWVEGDRELPVLTSLAPGQDLEDYARRVRADLRRAEETLGREIGTAPVAFAYPFGAHGHDDRTNHPGIADVLRDAVADTSIVAFHQDEQDTWAPATCADPRLGLRRLEVGDWTGPQLLARLAAASGELGATVDDCR